MAGTYGYITLAELRGELLDRLQDSGAVFTPVQECNTYIVESLRVLNAQVGLWNEEFEFSFNPGDAWKSINVDSSPRQQTVTDSYLYSQMEAMLMEPMTGGVWTGTNQYNIELLSGGGGERWTHYEAGSRERKPLARQEDQGARQPWQAVSRHGEAREHQEGQEEVCQKEGVMQPLITGTDAMKGQPQVKAPARVGHRKLTVEGAYLGRKRETQKRESKTSTRKRA